MVINFRGKKKLATITGTPGAGLFGVKMPGGGTGPFCLLAEQTRWGLIPPGREETYFGPGGRQEGSADGGRC